jgi:hypothetical protein
MDYLMDHLSVLVGYLRIPKYHLGAYLGYGVFKTRVIKSLRGYQKATWGAT